MKVLQQTWAIILGLLLGGIILPPCCQAGVVQLPNFDTSDGTRGMNRTDLKNWHVNMGIINIYPNSTANPASSNTTYAGLTPHTWLLSQNQLTLKPGDVLEFEAMLRPGDRVGQIGLGLGDDLGQAFAFTDTSSSGFTRLRYEPSFTAPVTGFLRLDNFFEEGEVLVRPVQGPTLAEPSTVLLFGLTALGLVSFGWLRRRGVIA